MTKSQPDNQPNSEGNYQNNRIMNRTAYYEELLKSMDAGGMSMCIEMNGEYARVYGIPN